METGPVLLVAREILHRDDIPTLTEVSQLKSYLLPLEELLLKLRVLIDRQLTDSHRI